ncbi:MAG TPA: sugar ABC transporter substrate-binding protein [Thermoleophilaceae bacterium]|nr:sugar ABC transporter substrate-binding protein [Thermoleophilaceae bacterium]
MRRVAHILLTTMLVLGLAAFVAACGDDDDDGGGGSGSKDDVSLSQGRDLTIAVITHGEGDSFWAVAKAGAEKAGEDMGVQVKYSESANDPQKQAQLIDSAVTEKVDGIATSLPDPDALGDPLKNAVDAGIPVITLNSGAGDYAELGAITHVGQDEAIAGEAAGRRLADEGGQKLICVVHEQGNTGLEERCAGAKEGFGGEVENVQVKGVADVATTLTEIQSKLESDDSIDSILTLNPDIAVAARDAVQGASSEATLATFDLSGDVVKAIKADEILFAIDQQQYLQGYLPVVFLTLFNENANTVGGGQPVLTGPGFVDKANAETVEKLAEEGTR